MTIDLYKSSTCPQCRVVKMKLDKKGIVYNEHYIEDMDAAALDAAGVKGIPTLVIDGEKMTDVGTINRWINAQEAQNG